MKKLIPTWLLFLSVVYGNSFFLLPDQSSDALYALKQKIKAAQNSIVLITPFALDKSLRKAIIKRLPYLDTFTLITSSEKIAGSFAIYKNSDVKLLRSDNVHNLQMTLLLIDERHGCLSSVGLIKNITRSQTGIITCSSTSEEIDFYQSVIRRLDLRSDAYFK